MRHENVMQCLALALKIQSKYSIVFLCPLPIDEVSAVSHWVQGGVGDKEDLAKLLEHLCPRGPANDAAALLAVADYLVDCQHDLKVRS